MTRVTDTRTGSDADLEQVLSGLLEQARTGTLKLSGPDGRVKYVYFKRGMIELLKTTRSKTLLGKALLKRRKLTYEQLLAALERQRAATRPLRLGEILVGMGIVLDSDVHQALAYQIAEEVFELFTWPEARSEFFRGEPPLDIFDPEDLQARVSLSPVQLAREAVRRQKELAEIQRTIPSLRDVFVPRSAERPADDAHNPAVQELLTCLDGQRSVDEILELVRAPDLMALRTLAKMKIDDQVAPLPGKELIELGELLEEQGEFERARQRYLRAEELHYPDFDLPRRIGQIAEALGDLPEACRRYQTYADLCDQAGYPEVASQTLARVVELDPSLRAARERCAELTAKSARALSTKAADPETPEAERAPLEAQAQERAERAVALYEDLLQVEERAEEQQRLLEALREVQPERVDLRIRLAELALERGDLGHAIEEYQELAMRALEVEDLPRAIELLERILEIEPGEILALQSLAATYSRMGQNDKAVAQYLRFARTFEESGLATASADTLIEIYEKVTQLDPDNHQARMFLARAYSQKAETDKSTKNLLGMIESLRRSAREPELLEALDRLHEVKPLEPQLLLERANLAKKLGKDRPIAPAFREVAEAAARGGDWAMARQAWGEVLSALPGDLDAHVALARLDQQDKQDEAAARRYAAAFELALLAGRVDLAEEAVKRALDCEPDRPAHRERLARILVLRSRPDEAARTLVRAARRARDDEDFGVARSWARRALELDGTCDDARDLLENLRRAAVGAASSSGWGSDTGMVGGEPQPEYGRGTMPTIASPKGPTIEGMKMKNKKLGGALEKLRALKGGGAEAGAGVEEPSGEAAAPAAISKGPEAPGDPADAGVSKKASSAMSRLKQLKGGGGAIPPAAPAPAPTPTASDGIPVIMPESTETAPLAGSASEEAPPVAAAPPAEPAAQKAPEPAEDKTSHKAASALSKLKALKAGSGAEPGSEEKKLSKGPEAPGDPADAQTAQKAVSAMSKLKALKAGGGAAAPAPAASSEEKKLSKGPEAPGDPADAATAQKASSAMSRLKALKAGGAAAPAASAAEPGSEEKKLSKGPEAPGDPADAQTAQKAVSAMSKLKALKSGGGAPNGPTPAAAIPEGQKISKGPEAPGDPADAAVSQKAGNAMNKLKALRGTPGASS